MSNKIAMQSIEAHSDTPPTAAFAKHANETHIKRKEAKAASVEGEHTIFRILTTF